MSTFFKPSGIIFLCTFAKNLINTKKHMKISNRFSLLTIMIVLISSSLLLISSCQKNDDNNLLKSGSTTNNSIDIKGLNNFLQDYYNNKYQIFTATRGNKANSDAFTGFFSDKTEANRQLDLVTEANNILNMSEIVYISYKTSVNVLENSISEADNGTITCTVKVNCELETNQKDAETGEPIITEGYDHYSFVLINNNNIWKIVSEEQLLDTENAGTEFFSLDASPINKDNSTKGYVYSGTTAANFARAHWNIALNPISNYTDYTNAGGDCTNFLSRCLREGGWLQTNNWFYKKNSSVSGNNMSLYGRSPSWAGANYFYQYITSTGMYQGVGGKNRVTAKFAALQVPSAYQSWTNFYTAVRLLGKGDICEIGNGSVPATIGHNMIISSVSTSAPYVFLTYRTATGYTAYKDRPINNVTPGIKLYGFKVNATGY